MAIVLVHGNPEIPAIWDPLRAHLGRTDVVALRLPGFGADAPAGFGATRDEYVDWLIGELEAIGEPVDLVGHDWGGGFALRVACLRPDLLRSWASDVFALLHPDYVWHDFAQIWQTPGEGEKFFEGWLAAPREDGIAYYGSQGIPAETAGLMVDAAGPEMARCVLALYRSAAQPAMAAWGQDASLAKARPGLAIIATADPFGNEANARLMADAMGAGVQILDGLGHWWMLQDPARGAAALEQFWATVG